jgi:hypothetical protein
MSEEDSDDNKNEESKGTNNVSLNIDKTPQNKQKPAP